MQNVAFAQPQNQLRNQKWIRNKWFLMTIFQVLFGAHFYDSTRKYGLRHYYEIYKTKVFF